MSVAWSRRKPEEPDLPDHPVIVADVGVDPANPDAIAIAYRALQPTSYAPPDDKQDDDVIEPTAVFKPWIPGKYWDDCIITVEHDQTWSNYD
jgi:hypothetical protein